MKQKKSMKKRIEVIMAVVLLVGAGLFAKEGSRMAESLKAEKGEVCVVIDAGQEGGNQRHPSNIHAGCGTA